MAEPVGAVLFDIDDTLCEYRRTASDLLDHSFVKVGVEPFFTAEEYGVDPAVGRSVAATYADARDHRNVRFLDGAQEALETLGDRYQAAAVTNGDPEMQSTKLESLGVEDHFETVVFAGYDVAAKPDPAPFEHALEALGVDAGRAVKIGNSLDHDVRGAHNAGLQSVWLDRNGVTDPDPEPHYRIESMRELLNEPWD